MAELRQDGINIICVEPEGEWVYEVLPALISVDKPVIVADGVDTATVTAQVPDGVNEITFYNADTGEEILTAQVDSEMHTATMQVSMTTPGMIRIRAGDQTITRRNEVVVSAVDANQG